MKIKFLLISQKKKSIRIISEKFKFQKDETNPSRQKNGQKCLDYEYVYSYPIGVSIDIKMTSNRRQTKLIKLMG